MYRRPFNELDEPPQGHAVTGFDPVDGVVDGFDSMAKIN
jgi:hypothetical protein